MTDILNRTVIQLMSDPASQADLNRLLTAVSINDGDSYLGAYEQLQAAAVDNPTVTVRDALSGVKLSAVEEDLTTLEAAGAASGRVRERVATLLDLPPVDRHGRVRLLDAAEAERRDLARYGPRPWRIDRRTPSGTPRGLTIEPATYEIVMNAPTHSQRLARARALTGNAYDGPDGAKRWQEYDRAMAEGGCDACGTLEHAAAVQTAQRASEIATAQLDAAFQRGETPKKRAKLVKRALDETAKLLDQIEQPAAQVQPAQGWPQDRHRLLHDEVQARRAQSRRPYLVELSAMASEGL